YYADHLEPYAIRVIGGRDMSAYAAHMGNVRAALEWSFSEAGDAAIGVEVAARAAPLFLSFSFLAECEHWCRQALTEVERGTKCELALQEALAVSSMYTRGNSDEVRVAIQRGLDLADALKD